MGDSEEQSIDDATEVSVVVVVEAGGDDLDDVVSLARLRPMMMSSGWFRVSWRPMV